MKRKSFRSIKKINQILKFISDTYGIIGGIVLKHKVSEIGNKPIVKGKLHVKNRGKLIIGRNFLAKAIPIPIFVFVHPEAKLKIGNDVFINSGVDIRCTGEISIGDNVLIGQNSSISDSNFHLVEPNNKEANQSVIISNNVWIAQGCIILPGVHIGNNSVIAAGSVVTKSIPENVLVGGTPAKILRKLNIPENWLRKE